MKKRMTASANRRRISDLKSEASEVAVLLQVRLRREHELAASADNVQAAAELRYLDQRLSKDDSRHGVCCRCGLVPLRRVH